MLALGLLNWARQEMEACRRHWEGALSIFRAAGEDRLAAWALGLLGGSKWGDDSSDYRSDVARLETAIGTLRELGDKPGEAQMLNILGNVHRIPQNFQETRRAYEACLSVVRETGEKRRECMILSNLALVAYAEHDYEKAGSLARSGAEIADEMGFNMVLASCLHGLAGSVAATGRAREAARLLGAVAAYQESQGVTFAPNDQLYHDRISADVRRQLGAAGFQAAWEDGYRLPLGEAVEVALQL
jgi:tetratricopeptide (TPR) repeat protein